HGVGPPTERVTYASQEEGHRPDQAPDPGRRREPRPADRPRTGSARREHHGVLQGLQRRHRVPARQRGPGGDHRLRGPLLHLHHQDPAGRRADQEGRRRDQGLGHPAHHQGRLADPGPGARDRRDQDDRPERQRCGRRREDHRRYRPLDGDHGRQLTPRRRPASTWQGPARARTTAAQHPKEKQMTTRSKNYRKSAELVDRSEHYTVAEAVALAKKTSTTKFDATVEVSFRLGVDPRKADQQVRGTVNLPNGTGKTARVVVFAAGARAEAAIEAGADEVGADELIEKVAGGYTDFDAAVATPDLMGKVGRLGRVLGPRGLMPNPKTGTVTMD